jgi:CheY-like chemotaxis protein
MTNSLLVEDSKLLRMATERALVRARNQVSTATDGGDAIELARKQKRDLIRTQQGFGRTCFRVSGQVGIGPG